MLSENRLAALVMIGGLVLASVLLIVRARANYTITHDEGISYLVATGHQGRYAVESPAPHWSTGAGWKRYWTPEGFWVFRRISGDLARLDIHPPLYFWILHVWIAVVGVGLASGTLLNLILVGLGSLVLYAASRLDGVRPLPSATIAMTWLLSGSTLTVASEARQYALLGLVVAAYALAMIRFLERRDKAAAATLFAAALVGTLTQYQFSVPLVLGVAVAGVLLLREGERSALLRLAGALVAAGVGVVLLHPGVFSCLRGLRDVQPEPFAWHEAGLRIKTTVQSILLLGMPGRLAHGLVDAGLAPFLFLALITASVAVAVVSWRAASRDEVGIARSWSYLTSSASIFVLFGLYVLQGVPRWAMAGKYLMTVTPLLYLAGGMALDRLTERVKWSRLLFLAFVASQAIYGTIMTLEFARYSAEVRREGYVDRGAPLILDSVSPGVLPTVMWHVGDRTPVYAATQDDLLRDFPALPAAAETLSYVSDRRYGNSEEKRGLVLQRLAQAGYESIGPPGDVFGVGTWFELARLREGASPPRP